MKKRYRYMLLLMLVFSAVVLVYVCCGDRVSIVQYGSVGRRAKIRPDYCDTVIPPNIAPLNFLVQEDGSYYCVKISSQNGEIIEVFSRLPKIRIPRGSWRELLNANRGGQLNFDIYVQTREKQWNRFETITSDIADDNIDGFLVYRKIRPIHNRWKEMGIYQRNLENYDERLVLHSRSFGYGCVHCHTFLKNDAKNMFMHVRASNGPSMLLFQDGKVANIDSRTPFGSAPMGHSALHPSGKVIVFTVYKVHQFFHTAKWEMREAFDLDSAMGYYLVDKRAVKTSPEISRKNRLETFPTWSHDGRFLYFCSAPILWPNDDAVFDFYKQIKYDLVRVSYDIESDKWGQLETVLSVDQTGLSISQPRVSPDGRFLLFCMCEYSCFPTFQTTSDLYIMDLNSGRYEKLNCNSDQPESWHSWSSNSRWIVFSSKRDGILFNRVYVSYIDENGKACKPFVLAQKDPAYYDSCMRLYQLPELTRTPIPVTGEKLARLIRSPEKVSAHLPVTMATPKPDGTPGLGQRWQRLE